MDETGWNASQMAAPGDPARSPRAVETRISGDQLLVTYVSADEDSVVEPVELNARVAQDAARRAADGWRIATMTSTTLRTRDTMLSAGRGQSFASQVAVTVVYRRG